MRFLLTTFFVGVVHALPLISSWRKYAQDLLKDDSYKAVVTEDPSMWDAIFTIVHTPLIFTTKLYKYTGTGSRNGLTIMTVK